MQLESIEHIQLVTLDDYIVHAGQVAEEFHVARQEVRVIARVFGVRAAHQSTVESHMLASHLLCKI